MHSGSIDDTGVHAASYFLVLTWVACRGGQRVVRRVPMVHGAPLRYNVAGSPGACGLSSLLRLAKLGEDSPQNNASPNVCAQSWGIPFLHLSGSELLQPYLA
mmetsp:Transcript_16994/g.36708  ORF Transcript_16994/g.36708 Transcript_16994/m.36708 type:complete len:102 (-) Transcript_16994:7-312(-)